VVRSAARAKPRRRVGGASAKTVDVFVEIPRGSRSKYELDHQTGRIRLDRVLFSAVHYPADYGFVMGTLGGDGDPLDAIVVVEEPTFPGCVLPARPIGTLLMRDEKGTDEKILAVPIGDPRFDEVQELRDLAVHWLREIETFFATYKQLEAAETTVTGWRGSRTAWRIIAAARKRAR
jgi:inorganic pyrophosphatase